MTQEKHTMNNNTEYEAGVEDLVLPGLASYYSNKGQVPPS